MEQSDQIDFAFYKRNILSKETNENSKDKKANEKKVFRLLEEKFVWNLV